MIELNYDEILNGDDEETFIKLKDRYNELLEIRKDVYRKYNAKCFEYNKRKVLQKMYQSIPTIYCIMCRSEYMRVPFKHHLTTKKHHINSMVQLGTVFYTNFQKYNKFLNTVNEKLINEINKMIKYTNNFEVI